MTLLDTEQSYVESLRTLMQVMRHGILLVTVPITPRWNPNSDPQLFYQH